MMVGLTMTGANSTEAGGDHAVFDRASLSYLALIVCVGNAMVDQIFKGIAANGFVPSGMNTFDVSAAIWVAWFYAASVINRSQGGVVRRIDILAIGSLCAFSALPLGPANWVLVTLLGLYMIWSNKVGSALRRAGWICIAMSVPMFWSKRLFSVFSEFFLSIDASLVSQITGTQRASNLVAFPDGSGYMQIAAGCSSMANVSIAILCWVLCAQIAELKWRPVNVFWCILACLAVVAINVTRISLIGFYPSQYDLLHGYTGATVTSWLTLIVVLAVCSLGVRRAARS